MRTLRYRTFVGDFETTVYKDQQTTEVWASACVEIGSEDVKIFHSIDEQFEYFISLNCNIKCYYHNLKFDGSFWLSYLIKDLEYKQAFDKNEQGEIIGFIPITEMKNKTFLYSISSMGQWYSITIKYNNKIIQFLDSLKLLPFSVKRIGNRYRTKHTKLDMEYKGFRYAGCEITDEEKAYIANDVLVIKEALEIMFSQGHNKLTIGSCCLYEFKKLTGEREYEELYPNLYEIPLDATLYGEDNIGKYIRNSYRGGWCYLVKGKENKVKHNGTTADVNSLYPSMMSSESGNRYPTGIPTFWKGNYIPDEALRFDKYYFVRIRTRFYIRRGKLPFVQIKHSMRYSPTEMLTTSDVRNPKTGRYHETIVDLDNNVVPTTVTMTLTMTDYKLLKEHYELVDFEILDGCYFQSYTGLFDNYIEKYKKIKIESTGALRELAKLFLNNLYGKMATSTNSTFKVAFLNEERAISFTTISANDKKPGYIPVGSAITSYARNFTIRAAQKNFHGVNQRGFIYADTDSIHCDLHPDEIVGIVEHPKNFCCWKLESCWDDAIFVRQKTYIEHITHKDREPIETPYYDVKCAGMPDKCKNLFVTSLTGRELTKKEREDYDEKEIAFAEEKRELTDFKIGLVVPGKLLPKRIEGGVLLVDTTYEMR